MYGASPILAAFVSPALFAGGVAATAAPILIHLLARRRFKRIRWAAMDFLIHAERQNRRRVRMEEWILLALRCLAMVLIGLLVARPFLLPTNAAAGWGGTQRTERVFVLDDSFSMGYQSQGGTTFDRAKEAAERLINMIREENPDDTVTLLRMSNVEAPVDSGTYLDETQSTELLERIDALRPSQQSIDVSEVIAGVAGTLERNAGIVNAAIYIISDFQRVDWGQREATVSSADETAGILDPLKAWAKDSRGLKVVCVDVSDDAAANLAVTELSVASGQLVAGAAARLHTIVGNYSDTSVENVTLELTVGNLAQPSESIRELAAGQTASTELEAEFLRSGYEAGRVSLPGDGLLIDDVRYVAAEVASAIRILIVNGEPSADHHDDEIMYLNTALRPAGEVFSGNETTIIDEAALEETNLTGYHVVILANVYRISELAVESLERFARQGGGVMFFLGDQVDPDLYNSIMYRDGEGLLPARLGERLRAAEAKHLVITDRLHPSLRGLSREGDPLGVGLIPFFEYYACTPAESSGDGAAGASQRGPAARVLARFDDVAEHPAIVERRFGAGRVLLITTTADKEWHFWPDHPTFLPVMTEFVHHIARRSGSGEQRLVGHPIQVPIDPGVYEPDVIVRTPAYPSEREAGVTAKPAGDGRGLAATWEHCAEAGVYQFVLRRREGGETVRLVAVNVDSRESDLTVAEESELRKTMGDLPFQYIKGIDQLTGRAGEARTEYWRVCLVLAAIVLLAEQGLAWLWGRRR